MSIFDACQTEGKYKGYLSMVYGSCILRGNGRVRPRNRAHIKTVHSVSRGPGLSITPYANVPWRPPLTKMRTHPTYLSGSHRRQEEDRLARGSPGLRASSVESTLSLRSPHVQTAVNVARDHHGGSCVVGLGDILLLVIETTFPLDGCLCESGPRTERIYVDEQSNQRRGGGI